MSAEPMGKKRLFIFAVSFLILMNLWAPCLASEKTELVFSTWKGFEVDKCASIWLLNKIFNQNISIRFYSRTEEIKDGIAFDTPDAKFRRYFNMSTYESFARHYAVKDPKLIYIGKIVHDIEVNTWEKKALKETEEVRDAVNKIIWETMDEDAVMIKTGQYFDTLYNRLN